MIEESRAGSSYFTYFDCLVDDIIKELMCLLMLLFSFNGVPAEERLHWRSFLVKLGADNLKGVKNEELLVACHKYAY